MGESVSDFVIQRLYDWGIRRIYGFPGDGINGLLGAIQRAPDKLEWVQSRHEEMAAFMACAHAKFTGQLGVCMATSGPGAIHLLNGLYDAKKDHQPVLAIVGQTPRTGLGADYQQEVDLTTLFKDVAGEYVQQAAIPSQVRTLIDRAVRIAQGEGVVTCVILPHDVQVAAMHEPPRQHGAVFTGIGYSAPRVLPKDEDLRRAAEVLNEGQRVAMLVGAGALNATDEVIAVAERLGAGVAKALLGKAAVPDDLPFVTGAIGLLGTKPSWDMMMNCDTLLMVGSAFPYSEFLPKEGQARGVQIDLRARQLSIRYPMEVNLQGDAAETLRALLPLLAHKSDRRWREGIEEAVRDWWQVIEGQAMVPAKPINPQRVFYELSPLLPHNVILTSDSGSAANWYARDICMRRGMMGSLSGNLATMGPGVPYAIAAKFAWPERPVIALTGDGAMQMNGMNELLTIGKYWQDWADPRLIVMVLNNEDLNQVTWEQRVMEGNPRFEASQDVPAFNYARYAESIGLKGLRVSRPDDLGEAWREALSADRPVVLDCLTDPDVAPLPPHITFEEATNYARASLRAGTEAVPNVRISLLEWAEALMPRGRKR